MTRLQPKTVLPDFVLFPPGEEQFSNPCLCWMPDDNLVKGLDNPGNDNRTSLVNSVLQLIVLLPEVNHELPLEAAEEELGLFTNVVLDLHQNRLDLKSIRKLQTLLSKTHDHPLQIFDNVIQLLLKTRFSSRFQIDETHGQLITLQLQFHQIKPVALVELLNSTFSIPTFFTGGKLIPQQKLQAKPLTLPHFLVIGIDRKQPEPEIYYDTCLEVPMELDFGKYLSGDGKAPKTQYKYKGSATFYKLHGFVTSKDGHYMLYSRVRSGKKWYKVDDLNVDEVDLSWQVQSKGVCILLYRLQDQ